MLSIKRTDVLVTDDGDFRCGDIVEIEIGIRPQSRYKRGRIEYIDTSKMTLDCSEVYESYVEEFKYSDIWHMKKIESEE